MRIGKSLAVPSFEPEGEGIDHDERDDASEYVEHDFGPVGLRIVSTHLDWNWRWCDG